MSEQIRIPVSADTSPMQRDIENVASKMRVSIRADLDSKQLEAFSRPLGKITGQADEFSKSMEAANARVLAFGASVGVVNAISNAFKGLVSSTVEVEKSLNEIKIIGNGTFSDLTSVSKGVFSIAKQLGVSFKDAAQATLEFSRQGKDLSSSLEASKAALALTRTTGLDAAEAVRGLTSTVNVFSDSGLSYINIVNKMSSVDAQFAVNSKDLIEGISRSASVAQEAGVSFDELTAFITTLQEKTGRGGAVIGNALKTIFTRVQNPEILKDIQALNIAVTDVYGNTLPATQIIRSLANEFDGLDKNVKNNILLKVGGGFQVDKLAAALNDVANANGTFQRSLAVTQSNTGNVLEKVSKLNQTVDSAFANTVTSAKELGSTIGQIGFAEDFRKILENSSSLFSSLTQALKGGSEDEEGSSIGQGLAKGIVKGIGSVISGPGLFLFGGILIKLSADFAKFSVSGIQTLIGITSKSKEQEAIQRSIQTVLANSADLQTKLFNLEGDKTAQAQVLLNTYIGVAQQMERISKISETLAKPLYQGGVRIASGTLEVQGATKQSQAPAKTAAAGYIPNLASAISSEKSQAPAGSKIIVDHSFPMGGGERGTMVYNSNETRIKNFKGSGGDAIIPNYPINAASGYAPNFADEEKRKAKESKYAIGGKGELAIDAKKVPLAGITLGGKDNYLSRVKGKEITDDLLKDYKDSPFFDKLRQYDKIVVTNVPVGNVYKFRQGLSENEDTIKQDFVTRVNQKVRPSILEFVDSEVKSLGLKPGAGLMGSLNNLKTDLIGSSTAGYILEEILKVPTLTNAEKLAQYAVQSEKSYFDLQNLDPESAEAFGLPKQAFAYADIKLGQKELHRTLTEKFLNQAIYEGGGTKLKNAAKGYIPTSGKNISEYTSNKSGGLLAEFYDVNTTKSGKLINDKVSGSVNIIEKPLNKSADQYRGKAEEILININKNVKSVKGKDEKQRQKEIEIASFKKKYSQYLSPAFKYDYLFSKDENSRTGTLSNIQGALAEKEVAEQNPTYEYKGGNYPVDFIEKNGLPVEVKARKRRFSQKEADSKILSFLGHEKSYKNFNEESIDLSKENIILHQSVKNSSSGYIPNFAQTTADILTVNPLIGTSSLDDYVQKYILSNAGTGLSGTFGFNEDAEQLGPNLSPEAKNDFLMSMLGINWLATFNRDKQADQARSSLINTKAGSSRWNRYEKGINTPSIKTEGGMKMVADKSNVIEGVFSGNTKELKYEDLYKHADQIFSKAGVSDIFNKDVVANMHSAAVKYHRDQKLGTSFGSYQYGPKTEEYQKIKSATALLRPVLTQGLIGEDKNVQAFLVNPPEQDKEVVGDASKYLTLVDPKAATFKKYLSNYLLNPEREPLAEGSGEAEKNLSKLKTTRQTLDNYFPNSYSAIPIPLENLKEVRSSAYSNAQLRNFFGEGSTSAFSSVEMARNSTTKKPTGIKGFWNRGLGDGQVENIKQILSASINRGGIFPIDNLDFKYNGPSGNVSDLQDLPTFRNSIDLPLSTPSILPKNLPYGKYKESKNEYDRQASIQNLKYKYNRDTKGVDLVALNAAKGYVPNFVSENGMKAMKEIASGNTPEAQVARTKLAQLSGGLSFEIIKSKNGQSSYVAKLQDKILASVDFSDFSSEISLDSAHGDAENLQKLLKQFAVQNKGRNISYPSYSENSSLVKSVLKLKDGINLQEGDLVGTASKGYNPNFAELTGSGSGMLYNDPNYNELGSGTSGKFLAPKSGEGFGQKIFYKSNSEKARHEYHVNKSIKDFEKKNPTLFAKNAISFTNTGETLTKNGLMAGFEREVINDVGVDEFATGNFKDKKSSTINPMADYAFFLSELMAQKGVKNIVAEYKKVNDDNSFRIDDVYAQNFKVNSLMQKALIEETKKRFSTKEKPNSDQVYNEIKSLQGSEFINSLNGKYGSIGARHTMFDTSGFSRNAVKTAGSGYVPNFANGIEKAIIREKMATGLPDSMIKVSTDSRAIHPALNPTGKIITNKIDEPNGASDVPQSRMSNAYKNASRGFVPNFADKPVEVSGLAGQQIGEALDVKTILSTSSKLEDTTKTLVESEKALIENLKKLKKIFDGGATSFEQLFKIVGDYKSSLEKNAKSVFSNDVSRELKEKGISLTPQDSSDIIKAIRAGISPTNLNETSKVESTTNAAKNASTNTSTNQNEKAVAEVALAQATKKTEKSFGDLAQKAFIFQSGISFATGAISTLGKDFEDLSNVINLFGQITYTATQGLDLLKTFTKGRGITDLLTSIGSGYTAGAVGKSGISKIISGARGAVVGTAAVEGGAVATGLGAGTLGGAALAGGAVITGIGVAGYLLYKSIDSIAKLMSGAAVRTENAVNSFNSIQEKYNIALSEKQRVTVDKLVNISEVSGTSASGALNASGYDIGSIYRSIKKRVGKDETYINDLRQIIASSQFNLDEEGNKSLAQTIGPLLQPMVTEQTNTIGKNGTIVAGKQSVQDQLLAQLFGEKIKQIEQLMMEELKKPEVFSPEDVAKVIKDKKLTTKEKVAGYNASGGISVIAGESDKEQAIQILRKQRREKAVESATIQVASDLSPKAAATSAKLENQKAAILFQTELLKKQLEINMQISKIEGSISTSAEGRLSIEKELLQTSSNRRTEAELELKTLENQRQTASDIREQLSRSASEQVGKFLDRTAALGVTPENKNEILNLTKSLSQTTSPEQGFSAYEKILKYTEGSVDAINKKIETEKQFLNLIKEEGGDNQDIIDFYEAKIKKMVEVNDLNKQQIDLQQIQINLVKEQARTREISFAKESLNKAIIDQTNAAFTMRKEIISSILTNEQKSLDLAQKKLDIENRIKDAKFEQSLITANPNRDTFIAEKSRMARDIFEKPNRETQSFEAEKSRALISDKQNLLNVASQRGATLKQMQEIVEAKDFQQAQTKLAEIINQEGSQLQESVTISARYFLDAVKGGSEILLKTLSGEYKIGKIPVVNVAGQETGTKDTIVNSEGKPIDTNSFISDYTKDLLKKQKVKELESRPTGSDFVKNIYTQTQVANPIQGIIADQSFKVAQFNDTLNKRQFDFQKTIYSAQISYQQKILELKKQEFDAASRIKDEFTQTSIEKLSPYQGQKASEIANIEKTYAQSTFEINQREKSATYQNQQSAIDFVTSKGGSISDIKSIKEGGDINSIIKSVLEKNINEEFDATNKINSSAEYLKDRTKEGADYFYSKIKETIGVNGQAPAKIEGVAQPTAFQDEVKNTIAQSIPQDKGAIAYQKGILEEALNQVSKPENANLLNEQTIQDLNKRLEDLTKASEDLEKRRTERIKLINEPGVIDSLYNRANAPTKTEKTAIEVAREQATERQKNKTRKEETFGGGFETSMQSIDDEITKFKGTLGATIPLAFRDGMKSAFSELSNPNSTEPLKNRLLGVASAFIQKINDAFMTNAANKIVSSLGGGVSSLMGGSSSSGSSDTGFASGGQIKGGTGLRDDVPAMLMGGEFVLTKSAVKKYGTSYLDSLNKGTIKKFANGGFVESDMNKYQDPNLFYDYRSKVDKGLIFNDSGQVIKNTNVSITDEQEKQNPGSRETALKQAQISYYKNNMQNGTGGFYTPGTNNQGSIVGQQNLLAFATQETAGTKFDKMSTSEGSASVDIAGGSSNLSLFALRDQGNVRNQDYAQSKQKSADLYFQGVDAQKQKTTQDYQNDLDYKTRLAEAIQRQKDQEEAAKKAEKNRKKMMLFQAAASIVSYGASSYANSASAGMTAARQQAYTEGRTPSFMEGAWSGGTIGGENRGGASNLFNSNRYSTFNTLGYNQDGVQAAAQWNNKSNTYSWMSDKQYESRFGNAGANFSAGNTNSFYPTSQPIKRAAGGYIPGNGMGDNVPSMLNGGEFVVSKQAAENIGYNKLQKINSNTSTNQDQNASSKLEEKLDELISKISNPNNINITVNTNSKGESSETSNSSNNQNDQKSKELSKKIKDVVMSVLKEEKRIGGILR